MPVPTPDTPCRTSSLSVAASTLRCMAISTVNRPSTLTPSTTLRALAEDLQTAWAPDALGLVDAESEIARGFSDGTVGKVEQLRFPKPGGSTLRAPVLAMPAMGQFHLAVEELRSPIDAALAPGVCGYRRGAEEGFSYSSENIRFSQLTEAEAQHSKVVVFADVRHFFEQCSWDVVVDRVDALVGHNVEINGLRDFAKVAASTGLAGLPAGYANSRLLGNAILASVDSVIDPTFVRWVDDYRIFVDSQYEADQVLNQLREALDTMGMSLNESKTAVVTSRELANRRETSLASVYHPEIESPDQVRAALRSVFVDAVQGSSVKRRSLRFVLPRLAAQGDDIALDWVLRNLEAQPWEAPRFASYLQAFDSDSRVRDGVQRTLLGAVSQPQPWLAIRLAALTCHTGLSAHLADAMAEAAIATPSVSLWSLLLRSLAVSGHGAHVQVVLAAGVRDSRVAMAALCDIEADTGPVESGVAPGTFAALNRAPAPLPNVASIL